MNAPLETRPEVRKDPANVLNLRLLIGIIESNFEKIITIRDKLWMRIFYSHSSQTEKICYDKIVKRILLLLNQS